MRSNLSGKGGKKGAKKGGEKGKPLLA